MNLLATSDELTATSLPVYRFTVEEYRRLGAAGVLDEGEGVELLEGYIVQKMNLNPPHSVSVKLCDSLINRMLPPHCHTRVQDAIQTDDSQPEPDLAIIRGAIRDFAQRHPLPADIAVLIEVADSSLPRDRYKCRIYGKAAVPIYWIINLVDRRVEIYTEPTGPDVNPGYRHRKDYESTDEVPLILDVCEMGRIKVSELLA